MAAKSGQMSQIELLLVYGANLSILDSRQKSAIDYAFEAGHDDIVWRLIEHQFELSDCLCRFICQGRAPNHKNGEHFLVVDIKQDFFTELDRESTTNIVSNRKKHRKSVEIFRHDLNQNLRLLCNRSFQELCRDIYDELDRREINNFVKVFYPMENGKLSILYQQLILPFLPVYQYFSTTRNQARQKLALLSTKELIILIVDVLSELRQRVYGFERIDSFRKKKSDSFHLRNSYRAHKKKSSEKTFAREEDSEPLYDSVPTEDDDDNANGSLSDNNQIVKQVENSKDGDKSSFGMTKHKQANKIPSVDFTKNSFVSMDQYTELKDQILKSNELIATFIKENKGMRAEIGRLQTVVDKLVDENCHLKRLITTDQSKSPSRIIENNCLKSASFFLGNAENFSYINDPDDPSAISYENRTRPQSISNHPHLNQIDMIHNSKIINNSDDLLFDNARNSNELTRAFGNIEKSPSFKNNSRRSASSLSSSSPINSASLTDNENLERQHSSCSSKNANTPNIERNQSPRHLNYHNQILSSNEVNVKDSSSPSSSSLKSSNSFQRSSNLNNDSKSSSSKTNNINMKQLNTKPFLNSDNKNLMKKFFPTKDEVIKKIEFITNGIKELLMKAKEGKHEQ